MKSATMLLIGALALCAVSAAHAQRGRGEPVGLARQGVQPERVEIMGTIDRIETAPCGRTTGSAYVGTHIFLRTEDGKEINMHIGSAEAVKPVVEQFSPGDALEVTAFRTDLLEPNHYVAVTIRHDEEVYEIRDEYLSPFWSGQRGDRRDRRAVRERDDEDSQEQRGWGHRLHRPRRR